MIPIWNITRPLTKYLLNFFILSLLVLFILNKTFILEIHSYNSIIHAFKPSYQSSIKRIIISQYKITCLLVYHRYCLTYHMLVGPIYGFMARNIQITTEIVYFSLKLKKKQNKKRNAKITQEQNNSLVWYKTPPS